MLKKLAMESWNGTQKITLSENCLFLTDNKSHFANSLLEELTSKIRTRNRFEVAYAPWTNGHVESRHSSILKVLRTLKSELHWDDIQWMLRQNLAIVEMAINNIPMKSRANFSDNELFLGVKKKNVTEVFCMKKDKKNK